MSSTPFVFLTLAFVALAALAAWAIRAESLDHGADDGSSRRFPDGDD